MNRMFLSWLVHACTRIWGKGASRLSLSLGWCSFVVVVKDGWPEKIV